MDEKRYVPSDPDRLFDLQQQALGLVFAVSQRDEEAIRAMMKGWSSEATVVLAGFALSLAHQGMGGRESGEEWLRRMALQMAANGPYRG
jgi:hypothetical protein